MDLVDRSAIASLHAAAHRHRAVYLNCLWSKALSRIAALFTVHARRTVPCG
ncbi:MAG: hypothetical protein ACT4P3_01250 [Betaproteobacteria bacterium]